MDDDINDCLCVFKGALDAVLSLQILQDLFYYGSHDGAIRSFNLKNGRRIQVLKGHTSWVNELTSPVVNEPHHLPDSKPFNTLYSCSRDGTIKIWDIQNAECLVTLSGHEGPVNSIDVVYEKGLLASGSHDGTTILWDLKTNTVLRAYSGHTSAVSSVKLRGPLLFSASWDHFVKIVNIETNKVVNIITPCNSPIRCLDLPPFPQPDDETTAPLDDWNPPVFVGCNDGLIYIMDLQTGKVTQTLKAHTEAVRCIRVNPTNPNMLFSGSDDTNFFQWDLEMKGVVHAYGGHTDAIRSICLTPDSGLFTGSFDHLVREWDLVSVNQRIESKRAMQAQILAEQEEEERRKAEARAAKKKKKGGKKKK